MTTIRGGVAAVTGAGSGIGRALALRMAREGAGVALAAYRESRRGYILAMQIGFSSRSRAIGRAIAAVVTALAAAACTSDQSKYIAQGHGVSLPVPIPRPSFTLTATDGKPFAFGARTRGKLTFLLFGYTHCPDVCPVHVANIAEVLRTLPYEERRRATLVFVTTDPDRDSLPVLRAWLASFDSTFVGLRGTRSDIGAIEYQLQIAPSMRGPTNPDGSYDVGHAAQVIVFQPDDSARTIYPFGVRQAEWAKDIPKLLGRPPTLIERLTGRT